MVWCKNFDFSLLALCDRQLQWDQNGEHCLDSVFWAVLTLHGSSHGGGCIGIHWAILTLHGESHGGGWIGTHVTSSPLFLWWTRMTANLTGSRFAYETSLWLCLSGVTQIWLALGCTCVGLLILNQAGKNILAMDSIVTLAVVTDWIIRKWAQNEHHDPLLPKCGWNVTSCLKLLLRWLSTTVDLTLEPWAKLNLIFSCFCQDILAQLRNRERK